MSATSAAILLLSVSASAQNSASNPLVGEWHGTVADYKGTASPSRELFVAADGTCHFDFPKVKRPDKVKCDIDPVAGTIELENAWKIRISLKLAADGSLQGHFYQPHQTYSHFRSDFKMVRGRMP